MRTGHRTVWAAVAGLVLALFLLALPALPAGIARAAGLVTVQPTEAKTGDFVSLDGAGFASSQIVRIYFSSVPAGPGDEIGGRVNTYQHVCDATTDARGAFTAPATFPVPDALNEGSVHANVGVGDYYIYAIYQGSNRIEGTGQMFVTGLTNLTPSSGSIGDYTVVNSTGLPINNMINIYFSSVKANVGNTIDSTVKVYTYYGVYPVKPDGTLGGGGVLIQIPSRMTDGHFQEDVHGGNYYVYLTYYESRLTIAAIARYVVSGGQITAEPTTGTVGSEIKIAGQGLRPRQQITVRFDGELAPITGGDNKTSSDGRFTTRVLVPDTTVGGHQISVSDITGNHPETSYFVKPNLAASPTAAPLKQPIELRGTGFGDRAEIAVTVNGVTVATNPPLLTANHNGSFTCTISAPAPAGSAAIIATDKLHNAAETTVTIQPLADTGATMTVTPSTTRTAPAYIGMKVTVEGAHFLPSSPITISYAGKPVASTTSDGRGAFTADFDMPATVVGINTLSASDGTNTTSASFILDDQPPPPPVPTPGVTLSSDRQTATGFAWQVVTDPSGVTYTLQVASDAAFVGILFEKKGLFEAEYRLNVADQAAVHAEGTYYWRVRAIDGVDNQGDWTAGVAFDIAPAHAGMPVWSWFAIGGGVVVLLTALGAWLMWAKSRPAS